MRILFNPGLRKYGGLKGWYRSLIVVILGSCWYVLYYRKEYPFFKISKVTW